MLREAPGSRGNGKAEGAGAPSFQQMPGHLLRRCHQISVGIFHEYCRDHDVTPLQFAALVSLDESGAMDQVSLGGLVASDRTTTAHLVNTLLERGLVSRRQSAKDRRSKIVSITPRGRRQLAAIRADVEASQEALMAPLGAAERRQLAKLLDKLAAANNAMSRAPQSIGSRRGQGKS